MIKGVSFLGGMGGAVNTGVSMIRGGYNDNKLTKSLKSTPSGMSGK